MAVPGESTDSEQRPNMWEELNRPRSEQPRGAPLTASLPNTGASDEPDSAAGGGRVAPHDLLASEEFQGQFTDGNEWANRAERLLTNAFGAAADQEELDAWRGHYIGLDGADPLLAISEADETLVVTGTLR